MILLEACFLFHSPNKIFSGFILSSPIWLIELKYPPIVFLHVHKQETDAQYFPFFPFYFLIGVIDSKIFPNVIPFEGG